MGHLNYYRNSPENETVRCYNEVMRPNDAGGIGNSADPDKTAPTLGAV